MAQIQHIETGKIYAVSENPVFSGGIWDCGDQRFTDPQRNQYIVISLNPVDLSDKIDRLWQAANAYTSSYINGLAVGLLTMGAMQQKPKSLAVVAWSSSVWDAYYERKALVTADSIDDLDFSMFGPMPHSVPELRGELGL